MNRKGPASQSPQQLPDQSSGQNQFKWQLTMNGRSAVSHSFSLLDALNPTDSAVKKAIEKAATKGDFVPLIALGAKDKPSESRVRAVAATIRALTKKEEEKINRSRVAEAGGVDLLVQLLSSTDNETVEHSVTALLNLSLTECVRSSIFNCPGAIHSIADAIKTGSSTSMENASACLFALADTMDHKLIIGQSDAINPLINLLINGSLRGRKDASLALFSLSFHPTCRKSMIEAGLVKVLVDYLHPPDSGIEEKVVVLISNLVRGKEGRDAFMEEMGLPLLADIMEVGSFRAKEDAASALLSLVRKSDEAITELLRESPDLTLKKLALQGTDRAKRKANHLIEALRLARENRESVLSRDQGYSFSKIYSKRFSTESDDDADDED